MTTVFLIPSFLAPDALETIPPYVLEKVLSCQILFVENERTSRRFLKKIQPDIVIDDFEWIVIPENEKEAEVIFSKKLLEQKNIGIISEAGCPGVADPGQWLVHIAQKKNISVKPLVGPNSILLALMASGMNGQSFEFVGYLPIEKNARIKRIKELETTSAKHKSTKIFIETPYRNNQLISDLLQHCNAQTRLCIGFHLTSPEEFVKTRNISTWKKNIPKLDKQPAIFLLDAE